MTEPTTATRCPECLGSGVYRTDSARNVTIPCRVCRGSGVGPTELVSITADLRARIAAALRAGHGPDCEEPDEDGPGRCVCPQGALARELEDELEEQGRYLEPGEPEHVDPPTDDLRALDA